MCLVTNTENVKFPPILNDSRGAYFVGYKILRRYNPHLVRKKSLISIWNSYEYKPGWNVANGLKDIEETLENDLRINGGFIHLYLHKEAAKDDLIHRESSDRRLVPVKCYLKDVCYIGRNHIYGAIDSDSDGACVSQVYLEESDYENAIGVK